MMAKRLATYTQSINMARQSFMKNQEEKWRKIHIYIQKAYLLLGSLKGMEKNLVAC